MTTAAFSASTASNADTVAMTAPNLFGPSPSSNSKRTRRNNGSKQEASRARSGALSTRRRTTAIQSASSRSSPTTKRQGVSTIPISGAPTSPKQKSTMGERSPSQVLGSLRSPRLPTTQRNLRRRLNSSSSLDLHRRTYSRKKQLTQDYSQRSEKPSW